jgi:multiple sugar transport system permease protein
MSTNPLRRSKKIVHLPLLVLAFMFGFPLVWLVLTSLQPREQIGKVPPDWLPRQHYIEREAGSILVTPPQVTEDAQVSVREWRLSKYEATAPRQFSVARGEVHTRVQPVWGNYPEAVRALTAGEAEKSMPLGELIGRSRYPWTPDDAEGRTITFVTYVTNTLLVAVLAVLGTVLSSALVAYGLTRLRWRGRDALFAVTLATMMIPFPVLMVPLYSVFRTLGWIGTLLPLWAPAFFGSAFSIFLLRQFFMTIPQELSEAARIDGCSEFQIFWRVILPLARPALSVVALFHFLFVYNDFLGPLLFLTEPQTFTMALGLQQYQSQSGGSEWHLLMAASAMLVAPVIALFFFAQRTFIEGISTTGLKG